jgi:hypothetical protein
MPRPLSLLGLYLQQLQVSRVFWPAPTPSWRSPRSAHGACTVLPHHPMRGRLRKYPDLEVVQRSNRLRNKPRVLRGSRHGILLLGRLYRIENIHGCRGTPSWWLWPQDLRGARVNTERGVYGATSQVVARPTSFRPSFYQSFDWRPYFAPPASGSRQ